MKKFLFKLHLVLLPFIVVIGVLLRFAYKKELSILERDLTCSTNIVAAVVGDSRVDQFFDPKEIPWLRNFGQSASPLQITAHKARLIAKMNPHLRLIIIDVWPDRFFLDTQMPFNVSDPFAPIGISLVEIMTREDMPPIGDEFHIRLSIGVLQPGLRHLIGLDKSSKALIVGGFDNTKLQTPKYGLRPECAKKMRYGPPDAPRSLPKTPTVGEIIIEHLMADLAKFDVQIILTTTPILWYEQRWTLEARQYFESRMKEISCKYGALWYNWMLDYQNTPDYWADGTHLNAVGARIFSKEKRAILEQCLKQ